MTISALVDNSRIAFFAALLFAVHPVHTDSVTYISGRRDILSTLFYILGFYLFLVSRKKKRLKFLNFSFAAYLLAIASKEMAATLPAIFFFYDLIHELPKNGSLTKRLSDTFRKTISSHKLFYFFFLLTGVLFTCYKVLLKSPSNKEGLYGGSLYVQFLTVAKILVYYIKLLFFPVNLIADYSFNSFPLSRSLYEPATLFSLMVLGAIALFTLKLLSRNKIMAFSLIWFFVTLLPVCHIFPHHELLAEHYLYLPSFGFVLFIALFFESLIISTRWRSYLYVSFTLLILLFSIRTFYRNYDWENSFTLWKKTVKTVPNCARALNNLGIEYYKWKDYKQAKALFEQTIAVQPSYEKAYYNFGNLYRVQRQFEQALKMYQKAAQLKPSSFRYHNNLGNAYAMQKRYDEAIKEYRHALKIKPQYPQVHNNLGNVYRSLGKTYLAITHYKKAIEMKRRYVDAYCNLGYAYSDLKQYEKSIQAFKLARKIDPSHVPSLSSLGALYAQKGAYDQAIHEIKQLIKLQPHSPDALNNLGKAYDKKGDYKQAIETFEDAIKLKPTFIDSYLNLGNLYLEKLNDKPKSLHYLKKWLEMTPRHPLSDSVEEKIRKLEKEGEG